MVTHEDKGSQEAATPCTARQLRRGNRCSSSFPTALLTTSMAVRSTVNMTMPTWSATASVHVTLVICWDTAVTRGCRGRAGKPRTASDGERALQEWQRAMKSPSPEGWKVSSAVMQVRAC